MPSALLGDERRRYVPWLARECLERSDPLLLLESFNGELSVVSFSPGNHVGGWDPSQQPHACDDRPRSSKTELTTDLDLLASPSSLERRDDLGGCLLVV